MNKNLSEQEYKEYIYSKAKDVHTKEDLDALLEEIITSEDLDYGKIVYAICGAMKATCNYINDSEVGGITGFQAGFIGWEMIREFMIRDNHTGLRLIDYDNMLYPQYKDNFQKVISKSTWEALQKEAEKNLKERLGSHSRVRRHWKSIVEGKVPFGYKVEED